MWGVGERTEAVSELVPWSLPPCSNRWQSSAISLISTGRRTCDAKVESKLRRLADFEGQCIKCGFTGL